MSDIDTQEQNGSENHPGRILALGGFVLTASVVAAVYTIANWHGVSLPPIHMEPIHNQDTGFMSDQAARFGKALLNHLQ